METAVRIDEPFAFKMSKPVKQAEIKEIWVGAGPAMAQEFYCTSSAAAPYLFCRAYYAGSSMTCEQFAYSSGWAYMCDSY